MVSKASGSCWAVQEVDAYPRVRFTQNCVTVIAMILPAGTLQHPNCLREMPREQPSPGARERYFYTKRERDAADAARRQNSRALPYSSHPFSLFFPQAFLRDDGSYVVVAAARSDGPPENSDTPDKRLGRRGLVSAGGYLLSLLPLHL